MDESKRRESKAKGGSVPPDERRHSKARAASSKAHMPTQGSSFDKRAEAERQHEASGEITTLDIEHVSDEALKAVMRRDLNP